MFDACPPPQGRRLVGYHSESVDAKARRTEPGETAGALKPADLARMFLTFSLSTSTTLILSLAWRWVRDRLFDSKNRDSAPLQSRWRTLSWSERKTRRMYCPWGARTRIPCREPFFSTKAIRLPSAQ